MLSSLFKPAAARAPQMPLSEAIAKVAAGQLTLIDIRDPGEISATGHATGALRIPLSVLRMKADPASPERHPALATDKPIALYCASGARAGMAARMLAHFGYSEVHNLGGLRAWQAAGGPVSR